MVDALVSIVIQQLATIVEKDVNNLSYSFTKIRAALKDAEKKQILDDSVRRWLQDVTDVVYDVDDVLDEWKTEILQSQIHGVDHEGRISPTYKKVCPSNLFSTCCFRFERTGLRHDIGNRIKDINKRVDEIASLQEKFGFIQETTTARNDDIIDMPIISRSLESSSLVVDVCEVFGRDSDKNVIISKLLSEGSKQVVGYGIPIISIVGMSGMGKTTLAQLAFNDYRVKNHFNKRMWVHVSKSFDKKKVAMNIIKEIGGNTVSQEDNISWEDVHRQLNSFVDGKRFLLVLDDVRNEDPIKWDPLRLSLKHGIQGSRILVTTQNVRVADMMRTTYVHRLGMLSDEDCWSLLRHYAFVGRQEKEECEKLKDIGMELAKKCKGLPLSAKTLGSLLCFKKSRQDWQYVLESDVWSMVVSSVDKPILPALLLSYNDLPSHLKQCFAYCSLISRDYLFEKLPTIKEWIAQGFLSDSLTASSGDLVTVGDEYFNNLVMRSFFQKDIRYMNSRNEYYQMHDLVYDFANSLVENESCTLTTKDGFSRVRHLSLLMKGTSTIPSFIYKAKSLRTLKVYGGQIPAVSSELFHHLTCLRTLSLDETYIEELPNEIEKLIHLRYLSLSKARFKELPKTVENLHNLHILNLHRCNYLYKLPKGIGRLVNLIDLDLTECSRLSYLPEGIGRLSRLCGLSDFIIGGGVERGRGCKIGELKDLNFLRGSLRIIGVGRVENGNEAKMACLQNKQHLRALHADFMIFSNLVFLELRDCKNCKQLPPILGKLPSLETLVIVGMDLVKFMGVEYFGINDDGATTSDGGMVDTTIFPKLKVFQLGAMQKLEEWDVRRVQEEEEDGKKELIIFMPCLQYLLLIGLPKLRSFPQHLTRGATSLRKLFIWECPKLNWMMPSSPSSASHDLPYLHVEELILKWDAGSFSKSFLVPNNNNNNHMLFLPKLKLLRVRQSPQTSLPQGLGKLTSLEILDIRTCSEIQSIPEGELKHLTALQELRIVRCPALRKRCQMEIGEDWNKISHIPNIFIDDKKIK
ncbi:putative disease resistance protein RGA3 [Telopea speciosissima]|uniref:putative disease resistance protein RGA3 n=1 Tax=Telopea speciosissima TaxID=54955 RepID=UPI001CC57CBD|nr:putative disease resistance protein RGA3 [Telopea speciosissima]